MSDEIAAAGDAPRGFAPWRNFLAGGKARRLAEVDRDYDDDVIVWQQSVYRFAQQVAEASGAEQVVDVGTGTGVKLHDVFPGHPALLQVDWRDQRDPRPDEAPQAPFVTANFDDHRDMEWLESQVDPDRPTLFILSDVIEHLLDPRPALRVLRRMLKRHPANRLVISTPDRERADGRGADGEPDNAGHVRQWTADEFACAMRSAGFELRQLRMLPQNQHDDRDRTICCELSCSEEHHRGFLAANGLPAPADHLVLTTEHMRGRRTGGIGTYIQLAQEADRLPRLILFAGAMGLPPEEWRAFCRAEQWIHAADICGVEDGDADRVATVDTEQILLAVQQVLFLYDQVRLVEYQDFMGIGHRVAQAKRVGLLPPTVTVMAYVHGNHLYLDAAAGRILGDRALEVDAQERLCVELADIVFFPSRYTRDLYVGKGGFELRAERHQPYPVAVSEGGLDDLERGPIHNLVFYGKRTPQKGYDDFVEAVRLLFADPAHVKAAARIRRVVLMGVTDPEPRLDNLPVTVETGTFTRTGAVEMLQRLAPDSLVVLPYRGDNHPLSVLEMVEHDCQMLAYDIGGVPEILPEELHDLLLCAPNHRALAAGMARAVTLGHWDRCRLVQRTRQLVGEAYRRHRHDFQDAVAALKRGVPKPPPEQPGAVTVIVTNLDGDRRHLEEVALGLRNAFHRPAKVILVDDGSTPEGLATLEASRAAFGSIPTEVVRNPANLGLAGARNAGLEHVTTEYVCAHDNDDVLLNRYLQIACRALDDNPEVAAVTPWTTYFQEGTDWQVRTGDAGYRPLGGDLGIAARMNCLGPATGVFRVSALREAGGWNGSTKAMWEDWELLLRLLCAGKPVWVIPEPMMLYRVRRSSMLRSYAEFPAWLRLTGALRGMPRAQAVSLLRAMWTPSVPHGERLLPVAGELHYLRELARALQLRGDELAGLSDLGDADLAAEVVRLRAIEQSTIWRASSLLRRALDGQPKLRHALRATLAPVWRGARGLRNRLRG
jgi:GT2 family glycosyltransferase/glycosyltransferase involved in cell wall biosynthesis